ncbi:7-carboxy-7-deazaguanine synthase QueE, partial [Arcobacteraceae bacterium]|nr:7-carboxy-7-deazaguanine synthase QueE [Arcobacteraceae bacterium]
MLEINEIFGPTIQGEGKYTGNPSVFVRFGKCNMQCPGFEVEYETPSGIKKFSCDSFYASDIAFRDEWKKYKTAKELILEVSAYIPQYKVDIVITGGEPLLYWKDKEFQNFMKYYLDNGFRVTIETNASIDIELFESWHKDIVFSMSVKLSNSGERLSKRVNINTLNNIISVTKDSYLKFVVDKESIETATMEIDEITSKIDPCEVYLMPLGDTSDIIDKNSLSVINLALKKGYKYSDRL